jgi:hypothetical protein
VSGHGCDECDELLRARWLHVVDVGWPPLGVATDRTEVTEVALAEVRTTVQVA